MHHQMVIPGQNSPQLYNKYILPSNMSAKIVIKNADKQIIKNYFLLGKDMQKWSVVMWEVQKYS